MPSFFRFIPVLGILCANTAMAQLPKIDSVLNASTNSLLKKQVLLVSDYFITSASSAKGFFADPALAGSMTIIHCTGNPAPGSAATHFNILFIAEGTTALPKPAYAAGNKTIYQTLPMRQWPVIMAQLEQTINKPGDKKLQAVYLEDSQGNPLVLTQTCLINTSASPAEKPVIKPPASPSASAPPRQ